MDSSILELLTKVTLYDLIWALALVLVFIGIVVSQKKRISKWLDNWRKNKNEEEDFNKLVFDLKNSIEKLSEKVQSNQGARDKELLQYRDDSRKIRDEMYKVINGQSKQIENLANTVTKMEERQSKMEEKQSKTKRAELKEKIERIYSECHPAQKCTDMQFETLKELIEEYEEHGGMNSFVHSTVEPEMYEWEKVKRIRE